MPKNQYNLPNILILFATITLSVIVTGAGCASTNSPSDVTKPVGSSGTGVGVTYKDGVYSTLGNYNAPSGKEEINVTLTLSGNNVSDVVVEPKATNPTSLNYQQKFASNVKTYVVGKNINELALAKISGSSLTTRGFNTALDIIKSQAK